MFAGPDEELHGLPTLRFHHEDLPNGRYEVIANLYTAGSKRYFFGYQPTTPKSHSVDVLGGTGGAFQFKEHSLGTVDVSDGTFSIYVRDADPLDGNTTSFGWAWIRLVPSAGTRFFSADNAHQEPVLSAWSNLNNPTDNQWNEYIYPEGTPNRQRRPYAAVFASVDETPPVMRFFQTNLADGDYVVVANLYSAGARRYYFGYDASDPKAHYIDTARLPKDRDGFAEHTLGVVEVADGTFELFVQDGDSLGDAGGSFGWAWIRLLPAIACANDAHQDPVLTTGSQPNDPNDDQWNEFEYAGRPFPAVFASVNETPPVMRYYRDGLADGAYDVVAALYTAGSKRYYYGFDAFDPAAHAIDTVAGAGGSTQFDEYSLGTVEVKNGRFEIFVQQADLLSGTHPSFGWAWIRLTPRFPYITGLHPPGDIVTTKTAMDVAALVPPPDADVLIWTMTDRGDRPLAVSREVDLGRAVQWASYAWIDDDVHGRLRGFDDVVWRSIVWAARKPFVMQGLPPMVTFRIDDSIDPRGWADAAAAEGFKPWLSVFYQGYSNGAAAHLSAMAHGGQATASVHAKASGASNFFYFDHPNGRDFPQADIDAHYVEADQWHAVHNVPKSKLVIPHFSEISNTAFFGLRNTLEVTMTGLIIPPGVLRDMQPLREEGPYRRHGVQAIAAAQDTSIFYADYYTAPGYAPGDPEGTYFNCITQIREETGYEWLPSDDVPNNVRLGTLHLTRALESMVLPTLFTHEYHLRAIQAEHLAPTFSGLRKNLMRYDPQYLTLEDACEKVRAAVDSDIVSTAFDPSAGVLEVVLHESTSATHSMPASTFYLFTEDSAAIDAQLIDVAPFSGTTSVAVSVAP